MEKEVYFYKQQLQKYTDTVFSPSEILGYFNYFIHNMEIDEVFARLRRVANDALKHVTDYIDEQNQAYCSMTQMAYKKREYELQVLDYHELYGRAKEIDHQIDQEIDQISGNGLKENLDPREICLQIVEFLSIIAGINTPTVILFLAPPYCPHNTMKRDHPEEEELLNSVTNLLKQLATEMGEELKMMQFFPVLTDSSYLKLDDSDFSIETLAKNFPNMEKIYNVPLRKIRRLNIPAFNFGCHGKDAHKWTERVHKEYTFGKLPLIILKVLETYLVDG